VSETPITCTVRPINASTSVIGVLGELNLPAESALMAAYAQASGPTTRAIILDLNGMDYMNSGGIGLLVTLMVRMKRENQRLLVFGLTEHYRQIFQTARLDEVIGVYDSEAAALAAAGQ
jgi:anti-sigma B factor antagonist